MARAKAEPFRGSFMLMVDSKTKKIDLDKLRAEIGTFLAARPPSRSGPGACRTIAGPGNVILCEGGCTKPGFSCEPKRLANGTYRCVCQKPVMQVGSATAPRRANAR